MRRRIFPKWFALLFIFIFLGTVPQAAPGPTAAIAEELVSRPGEYSGYSPALYDGDQLFSQYVTVRDGTKLAVDIWRPTLNGALVEDPLPVLWMHTPYNRRYYPPTGPAYAVDLYPGAARGLIKYGYVVAVVDARGLYASYGSTVAYNRGEWLEPAFWDAYDITEWFAAQPWCDGNIGMWGCSATGGTQLQAAATMAPHLKAIFPMCCEFDYYGDGHGVRLGEVTPAPDEPYWAAYNAIASPVDVDPGGVMLEEAGEEQKEGVDIGYAPYRDSVSPWILEKLGQRVEWNILSSPHIYSGETEASGIAIYNAGNLTDSVGLRWGPILRFNNLSNPSKLLLGAGGHCLWWTEYSPKPYPLTFKIVNEEHRWFDYWLKGIENGIMDEPPIYFFTYNADLGKDWRFAWQWPLPNEKRICYYLGSGPSGAGFGVNDGSLSTTPPSMVEVKDEYLVDYGITTENRSEKGLTYATAPLTEDVEVTGHPVVYLWISSTATDGDFLAYLDDVHPDGTYTSFAVEGRIRASNLALHKPPYDNSRLPYHRTFEKDQKPIKPGVPVKLAFNLGPTSYIFKAGHRIMLTISCADATQTPRLDPPPSVSIYRHRSHKSCLVLPIGGEPIKAHVRIAPRILNCKSRGVFTAFVSFPKDLSKGYIEDLNVESVRLNSIPPLSGTLAGKRWIFKFNIQDFAELLDAGKSKLTLKGDFGAVYDYGDLSFEGSDRVKVKKAKKVKHFWPKYSKR